MKTIWIINHYAEEPVGVGGGRHFALATRLRDHGWNSWIIGASVEHMTGRQRLRTNQDMAIERHDGIPFVWLKTPAYRGNGRDRVANMAGFALRALRLKRCEALPRPDAIIGSSVHPLAAWAALKLARHFKIPFYFEVRDLWPQALIDMGRIGTNSLTAVTMRALERYLYRASEKIIVLWPHADRYITAMGISADKIVWVPNGIDLTVWPISPQPANGPVFTLMYFGALGGANGLEVVIDAMALVKRESSSIQLRVIGDGPNKPALQKRATDHNLQNVSFENPVPRKKIPDLARQADAFVFTLVDVPLFQYGISPRKLFEFMAANRPTIFCCRAANDPIAESGGGISVEPGKPAELAAAILSMAATPHEQRTQMGQRARDYVFRNHEFTSLSAKLATALDADSTAASEPLGRLQ